MLTKIKIVSLFVNKTRMEIPHASRVQLQSKGISIPKDLIDFYEESMKGISENLRRLGGRILDPKPSANKGDTIPMSLFMLYAES